ALHEVRRDLVLHLAERIEEVARDGVSLRGAGDALQAHRARRVVWIAEREVVGRDGDRQAVLRGAPGAGELLRRELERLGEVFGGARREAELGAPVGRAATSDATRARRGLDARAFHEGRRRDQRGHQGALASTPGGTFTVASAASSISTVTSLRSSASSASSRARSSSCASLTRIVRSASSNERSCAGSFCVIL